MEKPRPRAAAFSFAATPRAPDPAAMTRSVPARTAIDRLRAARPEAPAGTLVARSFPCSDQAFPTCPAPEAWASACGPDRRRACWLLARRFSKRFARCERRRRSRPCSAIGPGMFPSPSRSSRGSRRAIFLPTMRSSASRKKGRAGRSESAPPTGCAPSRSVPSPCRNAAQPVPRGTRRRPRRRQRSPRR